MSDHAHPPQSIRRRRAAVLASSLVAAVVAGGVTAAAVPAHAADDLFGPNVTIFDESWTAEQISSTLQAASTESEFSLNRHQFVSKPGT